MLNMQWIPRVNNNQEALNLIPIDHKQSKPSTPLSLLSELDKANQAEYVLWKFQRQKHEEREITQANRQTGNRFMSTNLAILACQRYQ